MAAEDLTSADLAEYDEILEEMEDLEKRMVNPKARKRFILIARRAQEITNKIVERVKLVEDIEESFHKRS